MGTVIRNNDTAREVPGFGITEKEGKCEMKKENRGSTSVEAMLVVPLFLFAMLAFLFICNMIAVKSVIFEAAEETAEYMAEYAYLAEKFPDEAAYGNIGMAALRFQDYVDDSELVEKFVENGVSGVSFLGSSLPDEDGYILLNVTYSITLNIPFICNNTIQCQEKLRQKAYLGYQKKDQQESTEEETYVYVAENGVVYHSSRLCTYLTPSISGTGKNQAIAEGYRACEYCGQAAGSWVYITGEGERYHSTTACSRLRRTVYREKKNETGGLTPCQRCN